MTHARSRAWEALAPEHVGGWASTHTKRTSGAAGSSPLCCVRVRVRVLSPGPPSEHAGRLQWWLVMERLGMSRRGVCSRQSSAVFYLLTVAATQWEGKPVTAEPGHAARGRSGSSPSGCLWVRPFRRPAHGWAVRRLTGQGPESGCTHLGAHRGRGSSDRCRPTWGKATHAGGSAGESASPDPEVGRQSSFRRPPQVGGRGRHH